MVTLMLLQIQKTMLLKLFTFLSFNLISKCPKRSDFILDNVDIQLKVQL